MRIRRVIVVIAAVAMGLSPLALAAGPAAVASIAANVIRPPQ
ncbi:hypothetical protein [Phytohabitans rumicis]|uniref:Uncharacterized protein n=1 Tax=Phytohabitans rumicis TaxID=1076125 RepID=A0A6V8LCX1_9ACTN|nr:hypothetical protein [Phytohabitans rumicis]GFJ94174.1 hypothetical protein Prum_078160 [Phytohabitans rumicis]